MKSLQLITSLLILLLFISCDKKEDSLDNLQGSWRFGSAFIDGVGTTASGTLFFGDGIAGEMDIWFLIDTDTIYKQGMFTFSESVETITFEFQSETITANRSENLPNAQEFEFPVLHNNVEYSVIFDMIP